ncbi:DNA damage-inducible protein 1, partial [Dictyocoela muelleri]
LNKQDDVYINLYVKNLPIDIFIDTGLSTNFISLNTVITLGLKINNSEYFGVQIGNGNIEVVSNSVEVEMGLQENSSAIFKLKYYVLEKLACNAVIGFNFMKKYSMVIDFKNKKNYVIMKLR